MRRRTSASEDERSSMVRTVARSASRSWARASPAWSDTRAPRGYVGIPPSCRISFGFVAPGPPHRSPIMRKSPLSGPPDGHDVHDRRVKMAIVVRADLGMGRGKAAAQVAHAAVAATLSAAGSPRPGARLTGGPPKVVLRVASAEALDELVAAAHAARLAVETIADAGRTQLEPGTVTCAAIGPADDAALDTVTGQLRLY